MLDRSKVMTQTKGDTLVLQVGGWARGNNLTQEKNNCYETSERNEDPIETKN
jgi:hypothetical protein